MEHANMLWRRGGVNPCPKGSRDNAKVIDLVDLLNEIKEKEKILFIIMNMTYSCLVQRDRIKQKKVVAYG